MNRFFLRQFSYLFSSENIPILGHKTHFDFSSTDKSHETKMTFSRILCLATDIVRVSHKDLVAISEKNSYVVCSKLRSTNLLHFNLFEFIICNCLKYNCLICAQNMYIICHILYLFDFHINFKAFFNKINHSDALVDKCPGILNLILNW